MRPVLIWVALVTGAMIPLALAATSPWLSGRNPAYLIASVAGIACLSLFLVQPLLAAGYLPGLSLSAARRWHRRTGALILAATLAHVGGLWLTSPEDTLDALTLASPTPFAVWGVAAFWGVIATAILMAARHRFASGLWRWMHNALALVVVIATLLHALQIEGLMEPLSKWAISLAVLAVSLATVLHLRVIRPGRRRQQKSG